MPGNNHGRMRPSARAIAVAGSALLGLAAPSAAGAAIVEPPAVPHSIIVFPQRDFVSGAGFTPGHHIVYTVTRAGGTTIATSDPVVADAAGLAEVNHPGGGCWISTTPDILPGDRVVASDQDSGSQDATTTANVTADPPTNPAPGTIVVHGTAQDAAGNPLPLAQIEQRMVANKQIFAKSGARTIRAGAGADGTLVYDAPGAIAWTATYSSLTQADVDLALGAESRALWLGANPGTGQELTIYENPGAPGPAPPCTAPLASTGIGGITPSVVNLANVGSTPDVMVSGPATADITNATVSIPGFTASAPPAVTGVWSINIPQASIPEGTTTVSATFTGPTAPVSPQTRTILKDTIAPGAPTASPAPGTYAAAQSVTISVEPGSTVHYTTDGSTPTAGSPTASGPVAVTATQTLKAIAVDAAGNPGAVGTFAYTISPPAAGGGGGAPAGNGGVGAGTTTIINQIVGSAGPPAPNAPSSRPPLVLRSLVTPARVRLVKAKRDGIRLTMGLPTGTEVLKINVYRRVGRRFTLISSALRVPSSAGLYRTSQNSATLRRLLRRGSYQVQVTPGYSRSELGTPKRVSFRVV